MTRYSIPATSLGFLFKNNILEKVLLPGNYRFNNAFSLKEVYQTSVIDPLVHYGGIDVLYSSHEDILKEHIVKVSAPRSLITAVYSDHNFIDIVSEGQVKYYWKAHHNISAEEIDILESPFVPDHLLSNVTERNTVLSDIISSYTIPYGHKGILLKDQKIVSHLNPGTYYIWNYARGIELKIVNMQENQLEIIGQEIVTKDKVTLRFNGLVRYEVKHLLNVINKYADYELYLRNEVQLAFRGALEKKTVDELLEDKNSIKEEVLTYLKNEVDQNIIHIHDVAIKDIILPGEMREIFNKVVLAQKEAQAQLIKRREETAATRSLLNTARLMEKNQVLMRLKELEALQNILDRVDTLNISNGLDGITDLLKLSSKSE